MIVYCMWCGTAFKHVHQPDQSWFCDPCLDLERERNLKRAETGETSTRRWLCDFDPLSLSKIGQQGYYHYNTGEHCSSLGKPAECGGLVQWIVPGVWREKALEAFGAYILLCDAHERYWSTPTRIDPVDFVGPLDSERSWPPQGRIKPTDGGSHGHSE